MVDNGFLDTHIEEKDKWYTVTYTMKLNTEYETLYPVYHLYMYICSIDCLCSFFSSSLFLSRWYNKPVSVLDLPSPITVNCHVTCSDATKVLSDNGIDQLPVVGDNR